MPKGGRRDGAGRPTGSNLAPEVGPVIRLDELSAWRLNRLAQRAQQPPSAYLRDVLATLYDAAVSDDAVIIVDKPSAT